MKPSKVRIQGLIILAILFAAFTVIAFAVPFRKGGIFALAYLFTVVAFGVQIYIFRLSFRRGGDVRSKFYSFPIARIGVVYLVVQIIAALALMALGALVPLWLALIILVVILAAAGAGVIAADVMRNEIERQDVQLQKDVSAMRAMQSKVRLLAGQCGDAKVAADISRLSEDLRYSDPVSSTAIADIEETLSGLIDELQKAVVEQEYGAAAELCRKASLTLAERNRLCKLNKQ